MCSTFGLSLDSVLLTSAKQNIGIQAVVEAIVDKLPSPPVADITQFYNEKNDKSKVINHNSGTQPRTECAYLHTSGILKSSFFVLYQLISS